MPKEKVSRVPVITFVALVLFSFLVIASVNLINLSDYVVANVLEVSGTSVIIGYNCTGIVADTSPERAASIEAGMKGIIQDRPNTHDVFVEALRSFNITLESVTIDNFDGNYYYANLLLRSGNKVLKLDTKPSDAIALAVRTNSTIYINKTLLQEIGKNIC
jgi:bifunctional DNase/RNase